MSLIHTKVATIPDDPAFELGKDEWNDEHKFPGAGAGEVVFVDGSGHAATNPSLTFDPAQIRLAVDTGVIAVFTLRSGSDVDEVAMQTASVTRIQIDGGLSAATMTYGIDQSTPQAGSVVVFQNGSASWALGSSADANPGALFPYSAANALDLGAAGAEVRTGYFGTSVSTPVVSGVANSLAFFAGNVTNIAMTDGATPDDRSIAIASTAGSLNIATYGDVFLSNDLNGNSITLSGSAGATPADSVIIVGPVSAGSNIDAPSFSVSGTPGIDAAVTTADLVGKTLTFVNGICTGYA